MPLRFLPLLFVVVVAWSGCDRPAVVSYIAPVDQVPPSAVGRPEGWLRQNPGAMQLERYVFQREDGEWTEITVSKLGGDGGGLAANINRWRGQLGLEPLPVDEAERQVESAAGIDGAVWADMTGVDSRTQQPSRTLVLVVPIGAETWYYKITGHPEVTQSQKEALAAYAQLKGTGK